MYLFVLEPRIPNTTRGRLTDRLIAQGLLTPGMLSELRKEWDTQQHNMSSKKKEGRDLVASVEYLNDSDDDDKSINKKLHRKRRK